MITHLTVKRMHNEYKKQLKKDTLRRTHKPIHSVIATDINKSAPQRVKTHLKTALQYLFVGIMLTIIVSGLVQSIINVLKWFS